MSRFIKRKIGIAFWIAVVIAAAVLLKPTREAASQSGDVSLARYFAGPTEDVVVTDQTGRVQANDPVFYEAPDGQWKQIGYVKGTSNENDTRSIKLAWYASDIPSGECELFSYRSSGNLEEVIATMLPEEKRIRIQQRLAAVMSEHGDDLSQSFVPLVQQTLKRSMPVIESELKRVVAEHRVEIDQLAERWNDEIVKERLIPLAKREMMPIVRKHGQPPAEEIGREIWDRASLWRFGWRAVYDKTPLPEKGLVQEEWKRFVQSEAVPVIEKHMDDVVVAVQRIVTDVAANKAIRAEMGAVASEMAQDPETQQLVRTIMKETLIDNAELRKVWGEVWTSDEAKEAIELAGDRLEPVMRQIGDDLFGSREEGIDPNFARVLRSQVLGKDRRWIVAWHTGTESTGSIQKSKKRMSYPVVYMANPERDSVKDGGQ